MDQGSLLSKGVKSMGDIVEVLRYLDNPKPDEVDKNTFKMLLSGMNVIVGCLQKDANSDELDVAVQWLRLYMRIQSIVSHSEALQKYYFKTVPIVVTYIIGWLDNAPADKINFLVKILNLAATIVSKNISNETVLKTFGAVGKGIISLLWNVVDRVAHYNIQLQVLQFFVSIIKNLDKDFAYWEVKSISKVRNENIIFKIIQLIELHDVEESFKTLARIILNQYNMEKSDDNKVRSFHCKSLEIGSKVKLSKPTYSDRFWFDINSNPDAITFEGRITPKSRRQYQRVNVSLKLKEIFMENDDIIIQFIPPADISGMELQNKEIFDSDEARIKLNKTECSRFLMAFKVSQRSPPLVVPKYDLNITKKCPIISKKTADKSFDKYNESTMRMCSPEKQISASKEEERRKKQVQQVKPFLPRGVNIKTQSKQSSAPIKVELDEYENLDVSDAEPGQSYKNFSKRKAPSSNDNNCSTKSNSRLLKRTSAVNTVTKKAKQPRTSETFDFLDDGPSTSKKAVQMLNSRKSLLSEDAFDNLKGETYFSNNMSVSNNETIDLRNDNSTILTEINTETIIDLTTDLKNPQKPSPRTPKGCDEKTISTALVSYERSKTMALPKQDKCLVYHKRSDNESSSDESESDEGKLRTRPKRKFLDSSQTTVKKLLLERRHSESDFEAVELFYYGKKDVRFFTNISNVINSFMNNPNSRFDGFNEREEI